MKRKLGVLLIIAMFLFTGMSFADDMSDPGWTISPSTSDLKWKKLYYSPESATVDDEDDDYLGHLAQSDIDKVRYYIKKGYTICYRAVIELKDEDQAYTEVGYLGSDLSNQFGNGYDSDHYDEYYNIFVGEDGRYDSKHRQGLASSSMRDTVDAFVGSYSYWDDSYAAYRDTLPNNLKDKYGIDANRTYWFEPINISSTFPISLTTKDFYALRIVRSGGGGDKCKVRNVRMEVAIVDERPEIPVYIQDMYYVDNAESDYLTPLQPASDGLHLTYNGDNHSVDMVIKFDKPVTLSDVNDVETNYIKTNLTVNGTDEGSFNYCPEATEALPDNYLVFRYDTNYGAWARNKHREGLDGKGDHLMITPETITPSDDRTTSSDWYQPVNKEIIQALKNMGVYRKGDTSKESEIKTDDERNNVTITPNNLGIKVDGDPPEIDNIIYSVEGSDTAPYLNVGDTVKMEVLLADMAEGERVYVGDGGYFEFNTGAKATVYNKKESYGSGDKIEYRYTVQAGDTNTNYLQHLIKSVPPSEAYANEIYDVAKKMGIRDEYGNVAMMKKTGKDRFSTLLFPQVHGEGGAQLYVDTIEPQVIFDSNSFLDYQRSHTFELTPNEKGSMLENDQFYYYINKDPKNPVGTDFTDHLGGRIYPYLREGSDPDTGYSDISAYKDILIDNNLYHGVAGYTDYDTYYNPITGEGFYPDVDYQIGTASDVVYEGRREITGDFYIHTYMKDRAGNESWQTSPLIHMDNTPAIIRLDPTSTTKYVADININFELIEGGISGFDHYDYRWMDAEDLDVNALDSKDRYTSGTYTYNKLTDSSSDWVKGNPIDSYNQSKIPIPAFDVRLHGPSYLLVRAYDKANNPEYIVSSAFYFDKKAPIVSFEPVGGAFDQAQESHQIRVKADDVDTGIATIQYYFSESNQVRDKNDAIWKTLALDFSPLPENYDANYDGPDLTQKEATVDTKDWTEEKLNGYTFLHIYTVDYAGNEQFYTQDVLIDNGGLPSIAFDYDGAIDNRYKSVVGHILVADDSGIDRVEYAYSQERETEPSVYQSLSMTGISDKTHFTIDTPVFSTDGSWYLHVKVTDSKGNISQAVSEVYEINASAPEADLFELDSVASPIVTNQEQVPVGITKGIDDGIEYTYRVYTDEGLSNLQSEGSYSSLKQTIGLQLDTSLSSDTIQTFYIKMYNDLMIPQETALIVQAVYDNVAPTAEVIYSPEESAGNTNGPVKASLTHLSDDYSSEGAINISESDYTFNNNGEHIFVLTDEAGNVGQVVANVTWLDEQNIISHLETDQLIQTPLKSFDFKINAYDYSSGSAVSVGSDDSVTFDYQLGASQTPDEDAWQAYEKGSTVSYDDTTPDGTYYVIVRTKSGDKKYDKAFGPYILDNTAPALQLEYQFEYTDETGAVQSFDGSQEEGTALLESLKAGDHTPISTSDPEPAEIIPNKVTDEGVKVIVVKEAVNDVIQVEQVIEDGDNVTLPSRETYQFKYNDHLSMVIIDQAGNQQLYDLVIDTLEDGVNAWGNASIDISAITLGQETFDNHRIKVSLNPKDIAPITIVAVTFEPQDTSQSNMTFDLEHNTSQNGVAYNHITKELITEINGKVIYKLKDAEGTERDVTAEIVVPSTDIDLSTIKVQYKLLGEPTLYDSLEALGVVNQDVEVVLTVPEGLTIANNAGENTRIFSTGQAFDFIIYNGKDLKTLRVDLTGHIKKVGPDVSLKYTINGADFRSQLIDGKTNQDVVLTVESSDNIVSVSFNGSDDTSAPFNYTFGQNGKVNILVTDKAGNTTALKGFVDCIDKEPTRAGLFSLYTHPTNEESIQLQFKATKAVTFNGVKKNGADYLPETLTGESPDTIYTFSVNGNGNYTVIYTDDLGNQNEVSLEVTNFDREKPVLKLLYNGSENKKPTKENVLVQVVLEDENQEPNGIIVLNTPSRSDTMLFKENGVFTFRVEDQAGNLQTIEAVVDNIDRQAPVYTLTYSTTENTNQSVVATVEITDQDPSFKILNRDINTNDPTSAYNDKVEVSGQKILVTFDENGFYPLKISDAANNQETIILRVTNIDKVKPTITFDKDYLVTAQGEMPDLSGFLAYDDHDGVITDKVTINEPDTNTAGEVNAVYTVTDSAGNNLIVERPVMIVGDQFMVIANGQNRNQAFTIDGATLDMTIYNYVESVNVKYLSQKDKASGIIKEGDFKKGGILYKNFEDEEETGHVTFDFSAARSGWYTLYIQDTNRQTKVLTVFFTAAKREE